MAGLRELVKSVLCQPQLLTFNLNQFIRWSNSLRKKWKFDPLVSERITSYTYKHRKHFVHLWFLAFGTDSPAMFISSVIGQNLLMWSISICHVTSNIVYTLIFTTHSHHTAQIWIEISLPMYNTHTHTTVLRPFFPGPPGWAGASRELLDFMVLGETNRSRHTDHLAGSHSIQTNQCPPPPPHF